MYYNFLSLRQPPKWLILQHKIFDFPLCNTLVCYRGDKDFGFFPLFMLCLHQAGLSGGGNLLSGIICAICNDF